MIPAAVIHWSSTAAGGRSPTPHSASRILRFGMNSSGSGHAWYVLPCRRLRQLVPAMDRLCRASWAVLARDGADYDLSFRREGFEPDEHARVVQCNVCVGSVVVDQDLDLAGGVAQGEGDAAVVGGSVADSGGRCTERVVLIDGAGPFLGE